MYTLMMQSAEYVYTFSSVQYAMLSHWIKMTNYPMKWDNENDKRSYLADKGQGKVEYQWLSSFSSWIAKNYHHCTGG